jgi:hypothetical protein
LFVLCFGFILFQVYSVSGFRFHVRALSEVEGRVPGFVPLVPLLRNRRAGYNSPNVEIV